MIKWFLGSYWMTTGKVIQSCVKVASKECPNVVNVNTTSESIDELISNADLTSDWQIKTCANIHINKFLRWCWFTDEDDDKHLRNDTWPQVAFSLVKEIKYYELATKVWKWIIILWNGYTLKWFYKKVKWK